MEKVFRYDDYENLKEMAKAIVETVPFDDKSFKIEYKGVVYDVDGIFTDAGLLHADGTVTNRGEQTLRALNVTGIECEPETIDLSFLKKDDYVTCDLPESCFRDLTEKTGIHAIHMNYEHHNLFVKLELTEKLDKEQLDAIREFINKDMVEFNGGTPVGDINLCMDGKECTLEWKESEHDVFKYQLSGGYSRIFPDCIVTESFYSNDDLKIFLYADYAVPESFPFEKITVGSDYVSFREWGEKAETRISSELFNFVEFNFSDRMAHFTLEIENNANPETLNRLIQMMPKKTHDEWVVENFGNPEFTQMIQEECLKHGIDCTFPDDNLHHVDVTYQPENETLKPVYKNRNAEKIGKVLDEYISYHREIEAKDEPSGSLPAFMKPSFVVNFEKRNKVANEYCNAYNQLLNFINAHDNGVFVSGYALHIDESTTGIIPKSDMGYLFIDTDPSVEWIRNLSVDKDGTPPKCPVIFEKDDVKYTAFISDEHDTRNNQIYRGIDVLNIETPRGMHDVDLTFLSNSKYPLQNTVNAVLHATENIKLNASLMPFTKLQSAYIGSPLSTITVNMDMNDTKRIVDGYTRFLDNLKKANLLSDETKIVFQNTSLLQRFSLPKQIQEINEQYGITNFSFEREKAIKPVERVQDNERKETAQSIYELMDKNLKSVMKMVERNHDDVSVLSIPYGQKEFMKLVDRYLESHVALANTLADVENTKIYLPDMEKLRQDVYKIIHTNDEVEKKDNVKDVQVVTVNVSEDKEKPIEPEEPKERGTHFYASFAESILGKSYTKDEMLVLVEKDAVSALRGVSNALRGDADIAIAALNNNPESHKLLSKELLMRPSFQEKLKSELPDVYDKLKDVGAFTQNPNHEKVSGKDGQAK